MNSTNMKGALLYYFRYKRQMVAATEVDVGFGIADILSDSGKKIYEVEIKTSLNDLRADFKNKTSKHLYMNKNTINYIPDAQPNYFYFGFYYEFYKENKEKILEIIDNDRYGVILVYGIYETKIERKAKLLHNNYNSNFKEKINNRNCSDIVSFYIKDYLYKTGIFK